MKLRAPSVPLITVDPYFSVWSAADKLTETDTEHWSGKPNTIIGTATIDGTDYIFMGKSNRSNALVMEQTVLDITALFTEYKFEAAGIELTAEFFTPLFADDYYYLTRPVSYLKLSYRSLDGKPHKVKAKLEASEELCLDYRGQYQIASDSFNIDGVNFAKLGSKDQPVLEKSGDDLRIDWGYFYIATEGGKTYIEEQAYPYREKEKHGDIFMTFAVAENTVTKNGTLFTFAYDDVESIQYFGENLKSWWNKDGSKIEDEIIKAFNDYKTVRRKGADFCRKLRKDAEKAGGEKYADLLELAYRQVCAAHKLVLDKNGELLYISKECFSGGCAATVDVSYPSVPMFLIYNPELVHAMLRPVIRVARSERWQYDFAPHDAGRYPLVNGQVYNMSKGAEGQMPVEECGNMLVMFAAAAIAKNDVSFALENMDLLDKWLRYLEDNARDPENQLCTDDFGGHLAHNCNLTLKAISGIIAYALIRKLSGDSGRCASLLAEAKEFAEDWAVRASNGDGSYRLAFDKPGTFSLKYNIVWDKIFGTTVMPRNVIESELRSYRKRTMPYGIPLDNRMKYTKADWLIWTATLAGTKAGFREIADKLWTAYNFTEARIPMNDWYWTVSAYKVGFQHRSVMGGIYIKLLDHTGKLKIKL